MDQVRQETPRTIGRSEIEESLRAQGTVNVLRMGAKGDGQSDDSFPLQNAIDAASAFAAAQGGAIIPVTLAGRRYRTTRTIEIKPWVVLSHGAIVNDLAGVDEAILRLGSPGGPLVRPGGIEGVLVQTRSPNPGVTGFRIDSLVRSSWIRDCMAVMAPAIKEHVDVARHVGFEIVSNPSNGGASGPAGAYQNLIDGCTALSAWAGFRVHTRRSPNGPNNEANANRIVNCNAYSCTHAAVILGPGAVDNVVDVRADGFYRTGTNDVEVLSILENARDNVVTISEEVGDISLSLPKGTPSSQHTVHLSEGASYNVVRYSTQNDGHDRDRTPATCKDQATAKGIVTKNLVQQPARLSSMGGQRTLISFQTPDPVRPRVDKKVEYRWVAPTRTIVTNVAAVLDRKSTGEVQVFVAKNGKFSDSNRITFAPGEGGTAAVPIDPQWELAAGEVLVLAVSNSGGEPIAVSVTAAVVCLE